VHAHASGSTSFEVILAVPFLAAFLGYAAGVVAQHRRGRRWPWYRSASWSAGVLLAATGFVGPIAAASHGDFVAHMWAHLLVGMAAPLFLVWGAPVTLALRSLHVVPARRLSRLLRARPVRFVTTPIVAGLLNVGGLWVLYTTPVYEAMQDNLLLHVVVMTHVLLAGFVFTAATIPVDPTPHRAGFLHRAIVAVLAFAAHGVLAKTLYADPPAGVGVADALLGSQVMFVGGDLVDIAIVTVLCAQWYRAAGRRAGLGVQRGRGVVA
jgi:putative membrane protein